MENQQAAKDDNDVSSLLVVSSVDGTTMKVKGNPVTGAMLVDTSGGFVNPMTTTGDIIYSSDNSGTPARLGIGTVGQQLTVSGGIPAWSSAGTGTVTSVSVVTANGISGSVATATTTPAITLTLGAITPTSVNGLTITSTTGTLTMTNGKTLSVIKTMSFTSADDTGVYTLPTGTKTLLATDGAGTSLTGIPYTLTGTTNQVVLSAGTGNITFSLPQSIATSSNPQFATLELGNASDTTLSRSAGGVLAVEGVVIPSISSTNTLTNKRITRRVVTVNNPGATPTTNTDNDDIAAFTGCANAITSMTTNLSGTPVAGDLIEFQFTDNGTARAITWGASFVATTVALPTTTVISTLLRVGFEYNGSAWACIAVA